MLHASCSACSASVAHDTSSAPASPARSRSSSRSAAVSELVRPRVRIGGRRSRDAMAAASMTSTRARRERAQRHPARGCERRAQALEALRSSPSSSSNRRRAAGDATSHSRLCDRGERVTHAPATRGDFRDSRSGRSEPSPPGCRGAQPRLRRARARRPRSALADRDRIFLVCSHAQSLVPPTREERSGDGRDLHPGKKYAILDLRVVERSPSRASRSRRRSPEELADGVRRGLRRIRRAHDLALLRDRVVALEDGDDDGRARHELDELAEERALPVHGVEALGLFPREVRAAERDDFETLTLRGARGSRPSSASRRRPA